MTDYFTALEFENYGPIKKARLELTRLHALIGPNDSGKSSTLRGLRLASTFAGAGNDRQTEDGELLTRLGKVAATKRDVRVSFQKDGFSVANWDIKSPLAPPDRIPNDLAASWGGVRTLRLDPDFLRKGTALLTDTMPLTFADERGTGLGALLDAVFAKNNDHYVALQSQLKELFPTVSGFRLFTTGEGRQVGIRLDDGHEIAPRFMSEGMLYFLAFAVLPYLAPVSLILIEEPENGLHPARIADVMRVLRKISETTQVVLATHSPLVINEMKPEEVTLVTRTAADGTIFTPISKTENFNERSRVFSLGELWLSYADGVSEAPLFKPVKRTA